MFLIDGRGLFVQIYEGSVGLCTVTDTLLIEFGVTPSCVTALTDNIFCQSCAPPSCYCVVLRYPVPMSHTLFNAFSLEGFFFSCVLFFFLPTGGTLLNADRQTIDLSNRLSNCRSSYDTERRGSFVCAFVRKMQKVKREEKKRTRAGERKARPHLCSP